MPVSQEFRPPTNLQLHVSNGLISNTNLQLHVSKGLAVDQYNLFFHPARFPLFLSGNIFNIPL
jgi:hypothetical protein